MAARDGFWMSTYKGKRVYPLNLHPEQFCIEDIARGLSNVTRFSGQGGFYSVAEHSVRGAAHADDPRVAYEFLLHDGAEAYMGGDMVKPIVEILDDYRELRERMQQCIRERFGLPREMTGACKEIDVRMLVTEAPVIFNHADEWWKEPHFPRPYEGEWIKFASRLKVGDDRDEPEFARPLDMQFWPPRMAERRFLQRYQELRQELGYGPTD